MPNTAPATATAHAPDVDRDLTRNAGHDNDRDLARDVGLSVEGEPDTSTRLRAALGRLSRRLRPTEAGAAAGLTPTRVTILLRVVRAGSIRLSALAESEGLNPTMLSRAVSHLVDAGLLERSCDPGDRRSAWVQSTPAGRQLAERMRTERTDAVKLALGGLDDHDREALERALPALEALAEQLKGRHA